MPPASADVVLPVAALEFRVSVPALLNTPPPGWLAFPPVMVSPLTDRFPPGPSTSRMRNCWLLDRAMVAWAPAMVIRVETIGRAVAPSGPLLPAGVRGVVAPGPRGCARAAAA